MMTWFITVLVNVALLGVTPPVGWIQGEHPFKDKEECELMIPLTAPVIHMNLQQATRGLGEVLEIVCMTEPEWIERNVQLKHEVPAELELKTKPKLPEGT